MHPKRGDYVSPAWPAEPIPCIDPDEHRGEDVARYLCAMSRLWHDMTCMTKDGLIATARAGGVYVGQDTTRSQAALKIMRVAEAAMLRWAASNAPHHCLEAFSVTALSMDDILSEGCLGLLSRTGAWTPPDAYGKVLPMFARAERLKVLRFPQASTAATCAWLDSHGGVSVDWCDVRNYAFKCPMIEFLVPPDGTDVAAWEQEGKVSHRDVASALCLFRDWVSDRNLHAWFPRGNLLADIADRLLGCLGRRRVESDPRFSQAVRDAAAAVEPHLNSLLDRIEKSMVDSGAQCFANHIFCKYKGAYMEVARDLVGNAPLLRLSVELHRSKRKVDALEAELEVCAGRDACRDALGGCAFAPGTRALKLLAAPSSAEAPL